MFASFFNNAMTKQFGAKALNYSPSAVGFVILSTVSYVVGRKTTRWTEQAIGALGGAVRDPLDTSALNKLAAKRQKAALSDAVEAEIARRVANGTLFAAKMAAAE